MRISALLPLLLSMSLLTSSCIKAHRQTSILPLTMNAINHSISTSDIYEKIVSTAVQVSVKSESDPAVHSRGSAILVADMTGVEEFVPAASAELPYTYVFFSAAHIFRPRPNTMGVEVDDYTISIAIFNRDDAGVVTNVNVLVDDGVNMGVEVRGMKLTDAAWMVINLKQPLDINVAKTLPSNSANAVRVGDKVFGLGCSLGLPPMLYEGRVSILDMRFTDGAEYCLTSLTYNRGASGGGVFNTEGQLIGIISIKIEDVGGYISVTKFHEGLALDPEMGGLVLGRVML